MNEAYVRAKQAYASYGVDVEKALKILENIKISMHCWQGDDVHGFDQRGPLSGGIATTGNYPGRATTPVELMQDMEKALSLIPGTHKINLHASYAIFEDGEIVERDAIKPKHFQKWVAFAKRHHLGIDFNPTLFSHPKAEKATLSSADENIRKFWIRHCQACIRISEYFAEETGQPCVMNIWIPDGLKDVPADRLGPRKRFKDSLDEILSIPYDHELVYVTLESKVFGIGMESYTVGSSEFCINYVNEKRLTPLMDNGHYHPMEYVSDKISAMLLFHEHLALHVTRPVRWDSDHVVLLDDETKEIAKEIIRNGALDRVFIALDYFDASINRIAAWVIGMRNMQKALLQALLMPHDLMKKMQDKEDFTGLMVAQEQWKSMPFYEIWQQFLNIYNMDECWYEEVQDYEKNVLRKRGA